MSIHEIPELSPEVPSGILLALIKQRHDRYIVYRKKSIFFLKLNENETKDQKRYFNRKNKLIHDAPEHTHASVSMQYSH
jgi:hypothetical protein